MSKPLIALTMGDPAGIGPEIILKSLIDPAVRSQCAIVVCGSAAVFVAMAKKIGINLRLTEISQPDSRAMACGCGQRFQMELPDATCQLWEPLPSLADPAPGAAALFNPATIADAFDLVAGRRPLVAGEVRAGNGLLAYLSIVLASRICSAGICAAMATAPIHKEALRAAAVPYIGHTEILGGLTGVADPLTMFETAGLRIFFHSRHVSLRQACDLVTRPRVLASLRRCHAAMAGLGLAKRRIAVAGLNPHCGEHGLFGDEDDREVATAVADARQEGIDAHGPIGADSVFYQARMGQWDAVLSLYHDQGHIAAKTFDFDRTISITLGLPWLRSSVDHGTAMDIAGRGQARALSMVESILVAARYSGT